MREVDIKLVALDIDGTLLNSEGEVSHYTREVIEQTLNHDVKVILCTGRPLPLCSHIANQLNVTDYIVTNNGAEIWQNQVNVLERHYMDASTVEELWHFGNEHNLLTWMVTPEKLYRYSSRPTSFIDYEWLKFGFGNLEADMANHLQEILLQYDNLEVTSSALTNIEINRKGVNKIRAIDRVCKELNISLTNVMAIGDNANDLQMVKKSGLGIAVANATSELKDYAKYVTDSNDLNGVAKAIEKFVLT